MIDCRGSGEEGEDDEGGGDDGAARDNLLSYSPNAPRLPLTPYPHPHPSPPVLSDGTGF